MTVPDGMSVSSPRLVCKLSKSLYGLKQASRQWYAKLSTFLLERGYVQASADSSLFLKYNSTSFIGLLVYVDDIFLFGTSLSDFTHIKLDATFGIKDLGLLKFFLGLEVAHSSAGITLSQRK
jgi:hypothetical protein